MRALRFTHSPSLTLTRFVAACLGALLATLGLVLVSSEPASAQARVSVQGQPQPDKETTLKVSGSGFQSVKNGFGGIYVLFGKTSGSWKPSQGGRAGQNYLYAYDDESKPAGYQVYVAFPGSSTADSANGGQINADGSWSANIKVSGEKFSAFDRNQNKTEVDCSKDQCGIITVGAHGVVNSNNETFTPVNFAKAAGSTGSESNNDTTTTTRQQGSNQQSSGQQPSAAATNGAQATSQASVPAGSGNSSQSSAQTGVQAAPAVDTQAANDISRNLGLITLLVALGIVIALCLIALAVGVGSYMAMKSLLLGVNPEALERVRGQRAKRQIAAEHKRRRRIEMYRSKQENRTRQLERSQEARMARAELSSNHASAPQASAAGGSVAAADSAGPMRFFDLIKADEKPGGGDSTSAGGKAADGSDDLPPRAPGQSEAPTTQFTHVGAGSSSSPDGSRH